MAELTVDSQSDCPSADPSGERSTEQLLRDIVAAQKSLYRYALRRTGNHYDAEDLVQETLLRACRSNATFRRGTNLNAWLYRIMTNASISRHRQSQRQPAEIFYDRLDDDDSRDNVLHFRSPTAHSTEELALDCFVDGDLAVAIRQLPEEVRLIVYYADVRGYRYKDIARLTNTPVGTVMSRLSRARQRLRASCPDRP